MSEFQQGNTAALWQHSFQIRLLGNRSAVTKSLLHILDTHQWTELHHQQVGSDLSALSQTLQQSMVLESTGEQSRAEDGHEIIAQHKAGSETEL